MNRTPRTPLEWEWARGLRLLDYNCLSLLVRAPVDETAGAIAEDCEVWECDALGRAVIVHPESLFVFRLRGHP